MELRSCPSCSEGMLIQKQKAILFTYQGQQYCIPDVTIYVCNTCDEEIIEAQEIRRMEAIAKQKQQSLLQVNLVK
ncbi:YgiT-type zinc finger protein [Candidatus Poribacteria bacterium]|nr:YgiT-type zinc finger protein [Candidatus Poribacteria bacterium]